MDKDIRISKKIVESAGYEVKKNVSYKDYDYSMYEDKLADIRYQVEEIIERMKDTYDPDEEYSELATIESQLRTLSRYMDEYLYGESGDELTSLDKDLEELEDYIKKAYSTPYEGTYRPDPWEEHGVHQSDFI